MTRPSCHLHGVSTYPFPCAHWESRGPWRLDVNVSLCGMVVPIWHRWKLRPGEGFSPVLSPSEGALASS